LQFSPKDRPLAKDLLKYDWIVKNKKTTPSVGRWLYETYIPLKKKLKDEEEKKKKEKK